MVKVVERDAPVPLAATAYVTLPAPDPPPGLTVSQLAPDVALQAHPDCVVTVIVPDAAALVSVSVEVESDVEHRPEPVADIVNGLDAALLARPYGPTALTLDS
jgi:hypothetical protein